MFNFIDFLTQDKVAPSIVNYHVTYLMTFQFAVGCGIFAVESPFGFIDCDSFKDKSFETKQCLTRSLYIDWNINNEEKPIRTSYM